MEKKIMVYEKEIEIARSERGVITQPNISGGSFNIYKIRSNGKRMFYKSAYTMCKARRHLEEMTCQARS